MADHETSMRPSDGLDELSIRPSLAPPVTAAVVQWAHDNACVDLDGYAARIGRQCLLDWFAVAIAGAGEPVVRILADQASEEGAKPAGTVLRMGRSFSARQAALINGAMGHAIDYDDVNIAGQGHITAAVLPAALAAAEAVSASGHQLLSSFVAGYESAVMVGLYVGRSHYDRGFHSTATVGALGSATACALLLGLNKEATARGLGIAATQAAGLKAQFGTMCKPLHAGRANEVGLFAAQLAARGLSSRTDILECEQGFGRTLSDTADPAAGFTPARAGMHIADNLFKFSAACYGTHGAIIALSGLRNAHHLVPSRIRRVKVRVEASLDRMCNIRQPKTGLEAKFSLCFNAAMALFGTSTSSPSAYTDELVQHRDLRHLADQVVIELMPKGWPLALTEVEVLLTDGSVLLAQHDSGLPATDLYAQQRRLEQKFHALVNPVLGAARAEELRQAIVQVERIPDIRQLMDLTH